MLLVKLDPMEALEAGASQRAEWFPGTGSARWELGLLRKNLPSGTASQDGSFRVQL